ncbi:MAG: class I SAM-dependent methyltransferase [Xanthomonadales bacterium]|nr:class I SAM-dependent methyltransferase [Xanthomonadales bacterium]
MTESASDHWSDYWSRGLLTSLPQDFAANYDGEVRAFWHQQFAATPAGGRVLDLCTGNGAVALLAADYSGQHQGGLEVTAVDAAHIRPDLIARQFPTQAALLERIHFVSHCRIEDFESPEPFDLVTSQYGIEYCDHAAAARSVVALLRPGGRLVMVCHSAGSDIIAFMNKERDEYGLLEELGLFSTTRAYLDREVSHGELAAGLRRVQSRVHSEFRVTGSPLFRSVLETLGGVLALPPHRLDASREHLEAYYRQTRHGFDRLEDMLRVNRLLAEDPGWTRVFTEAGLEQVSTGELRYRGTHHAGEFHVFARPGAGD